MSMERGHRVIDNEGNERTDKRCVGQFPHGCNATTVDYQHRLNVTLVRGLSKLYRYHLTHGWDPVNVRHDLDMTFHQWENFQKLRYFGLVEKSYREDGTRIKACWHITKKGILFITNEGWCYPTVWTWRGEAVEFEGEPISMGEAFTEIWEAEDYAFHSRPHIVDEEEEEDEDGQA